MTADIIFFIPLVMLIVILQKAFQLSAVLVATIIKLLNVTNIFGVGAEIFISIILLPFYLIWVDCWQRPPELKGGHKT